MRFRGLPITNKTKLRFSTLFSYYEVFLLELATGLRRGELLALQWDDLNFVTGELQITKQVYRTKETGLLISEPKTKASVRTAVLLQPLLAVLKEYKKTVNSRWMFPSPVKEDSPLDPGTVRKRLHLILEHADCKILDFTISDTLSPPPRLARGWM